MKRRLTCRYAVSCCGDGSGSDSGSCSGGCCHAAADLGAVDPDPAPAPALAPGAAVALAVVLLVGEQGEEEMDGQEGEEETAEAKTVQEGMVVAGCAFVGPYIPIEGYQGCVRNTCGCSDKIFPLLRVVMRLVG